LRREGHGGRHQFLVLLRYGAVGECRLVERLESGHRRRRKLAHRANPFEVRHVEHRRLLPTSWLVDSEKKVTPVRDRALAGGPPPPDRRRPYPQGTGRRT